MPLSKYFVGTWLVLLIAVFVWLSVHDRTAYHYSTDESMHVHIAEQDTIAGVVQYAHYEAHPPVLYLLLHYWMKISDTPAFVRGLSLLFGMLLIPLYYKIGETLNGQMTGVVCAALAGFSHGLVIQSYVVRHYAVFVFFLSLSFYFYLLWRQEKRNLYLSGYFVFAVLACLTHFSGIFGVFVMAAHETLSFWCAKKTKRHLPLRWMLVNLVIAIIACTAYTQWQPTLAPLPLVPHLASLFTLKGGTLAIYMLIYPLSILDFILPSPHLWVGVLLMLIVFLAMPEHARRSGMTLRSFLTLTALAYGFGEILFASNIYLVGGNRRNLWLLPFTLPALAWMLVVLYDRVRPFLAGHIRLPAPPLAMMLVLAAGLIIYTPAGRSGSDNVQESNMTQVQWQEMTHYLGTLDRRQIIVADKDSAIGLTNLYRYMGDMAFTGKFMAALAPYQNTQILFNPYVVVFYDKKSLVDTMQEAQERHLLDAVKTLVFLRLQWAHSPVMGLMLCPALKKEIVAFPAPTDGHSLTEFELRQLNMAVIRVSKDDFFKDVMSPSGKAHDCLDDERDPSRNDTM